MILIKGMEMPTACRHGECNFACSAAYQTGLICIVRKQYVVPGEVPGDCPCSLVPPHGRLIDADALMLEIQEYIDEYGWDVDEHGFHSEKWCAMKETEMAINDASTVIPADEDGET